MSNLSMDAQRYKKRALDYLEVLNQGREWLEDCLQIEYASITDFENSLRTGVDLCLLAQKFLPSVVPKIYYGKCWRSVCKQKALSPPKHDHLFPKDNGSGPSESDESISISNTNNPGSNPDNVSNISTSHSNISMSNSLNPDSISNISTSHSDIVMSNSENNTDSISNIAMSNPDILENIIMDNANILNDLEPTISTPNNTSFDSLIVEDKTTDTEPHSFFSPTYQLDYRYTDNIMFFLQSAKAIGLPNVFLFETISLYEMKDFPQVIFCLHALSHFLVFKNIFNKNKLIKSKATKDYTKQDLNLKEKEMFEREKQGRKLPEFHSVRDMVFEDLKTDVGYNVWLFLTLKNILNFSENASKKDIKAGVQNYFKQQKDLKTFHANRCLEILSGMKTSISKVTRTKLHGDFLLKKIADQIVCFMSLKHKKDLETLGFLAFVLRKVLESFDGSSSSTKPDCCLDLLRICKDNGLPKGFLIPHYNTMNRFWNHDSYSNITVGNLNTMGKDSNITDRNLNTMSKGPNIADRNSNITNEHSNLMNGYSNLMNEHSNITNEYANIMNEYSNITNEHSNPTNEYSNLMNEYSNITNEHLNTTNEHLTFKTSVALFLVTEQKKLFMYITNENMKSALTALGRTICIKTRVKDALTSFFKLQESKRQISTFLKTLMYQQFYVTLFSNQKKLKKNILQTAYHYCSLLKCGSNMCLEDQITFYKDKTDHLSFEIYQIENYIDELEMRISLLLNNQLLLKNISFLRPKIDDFINVQIDLKNHNYLFKLLQNEHDIMFHMLKGSQSDVYALSRLFMHTNKDLVCFVGILEGCLMKIFPFVYKTMFADHNGLAFDSHISSEKKDSGGQEMERKDSGGQSIERKDLEPQGIERNCLEGQGNRKDLDSQSMEINCLEGQGNRKDLESQGNRNCLEQKMVVYDISKLNEIQNDDKTNPTETNNTTAIQREGSDCNPRMSPIQSREMKNSHITPIQSLESNCNLSVPQTKSEQFVQKTIDKIETESLAIYNNLQHMTSVLLHTHDSPLKTNINNLVFTETQLDPQILYEEIYNKKETNENVLEDKITFNTYIGHLEAIKTQLIDLLRVIGDVEYLPHYVRSYFCLVMNLGHKRWVQFTHLRNTTFEHFVHSGKELTHHEHGESEELELEKELTHHKHGDSEHPVDSQNELTHHNNGDSDLSVELNSQNELTHHKHGESDLSVELNSQNELTHHKHGESDLSVELNSQNELTYDNNGDSGLIMNNVTLHSQHTVYSESQDSSTNLSGQNRQSEHSLNLGQGSVVIRGPESVLLEKTTNSLCTPPNTTNMVTNKSMDPKQDIHKQLHDRLSFQHFLTSTEAKNIIQNLSEFYLSKCICPVLESKTNTSVICEILKNTYKHNTSQYLQPLSTTLNDIRLKLINVILDSIAYKQPPIDVYNKFSYSKPYVLLSGKEANKIISIMKNTIHFEAQDSKILDNHIENLQIYKDTEDLVGTLVEPSRLKSQQIDTTLIQRNDFTSEYVSTPIDSSHNLKSQQFDNTFSETNNHLNKENQLIKDIINYHTPLNLTSFYNELQTTLSEIQSLEDNDKLITFYLNKPLFKNLKEKSMTNSFNIAKLRLIQILKIMYRPTLTDLLESEPTEIESIRYQQAVEYIKGEFQMEDKVGGISGSALGRDDSFEKNRGICSSNEQKPENTQADTNQFKEDIGSFEEQKPENTQTDTTQFKGDIGSFEEQKPENTQADTTQFMRNQEITHTKTILNEKIHNLHLTVPLQEKSHSKSFFKNNNPPSKNEYKIQYNTLYNKQDLQILFNNTKYEIFLKKENQIHETLKDFKDDLKKTIKLLQEQKYTKKHTHHEELLLSILDDLKTNKIQNKQRTITLKNLKEQYKKTKEQKEKLQRRMKANEQYLSSFASKLIKKRKNYRTKNSLYGSFKIKGPELIQTRVFKRFMQQNESQKSESMKESRIGDKTDIESYFHDMVANNTKHNGDLDNMSQKTTQTDYQQELGENQSQKMAQEDNQQNSKDTLNDESLSQKMAKTDHQQNSVKNNSTSRTEARMVKGSKIEKYIDSLTQQTTGFNKTVNQTQQNIDLNQMIKKLSFIFSCDTPGEFTCEIFCENELIAEPFTFRLDELLKNKYQGKKEYRVKDLCIMNVEELIQLINRKFIA